MKKTPNISLEMVPEAAVKPQRPSGEDGCAPGLLQEGEDTARAGTAGGGGAQGDVRSTQASTSLFPKDRN